MQINNLAGIVYDSIYYTAIHFNTEVFRSVFKIFAKNEDDIFEHYYEFKKRHAVEPPENMYIFFFTNGETPTLITAYLDENFRDLNYSPQSVLALFQDKDKFRKFAYQYLLKPFENNVNVEQVIKGDNQNTSTASALLTSIHTKYPMQISRFFHDFDELMNEFTSYFRLIMHKADIYRSNKNKDIYETAVNDFLNSNHVNEYYKFLYVNKTLNLDSQKFAISFFARFGIKAPPKMNDESTLIIGDKCSNTSTIYANYKHITKKSASSIFTLDINNDIINALRKGEKNITQLCFMINYSRSHIAKHLGVLKDELAIIVSRKDGNESYYIINDAYFKAAEIVLDKACSDIYNR